MATIANATSLLDYWNWGGWGISDEAWAIIMLVVGGIVASAINLNRGDIAYMLVVIWAFERSSRPAAYAHTGTRE